MLKLWQLFQDLNNFLNSPEFVAKRQQIGEMLITIGQYIKGDDIPIFGSSDAETDVEESIRQVTAFIENQGGTVPMMGAGDRREQLIELLKIAVPILLRLL